MTSPILQYINSLDNIHLIRCINYWLSDTHFHVQFFGLPFPENKADFYKDQVMDRHIRELHLQEEAYQQKAEFQLALEDIPNFHKLDAVTFQAKYLEARESMALQVLIPLELSLIRMYETRQLNLFNGNRELLFDKILFHAQVVPWGELEKQINLIF